jgi:formamidopyrimidine-DNA glycosylase
MPEAPEITSRAREMDSALRGKVIQSLEIIQPKCLNLAPEEFSHYITGAEIESVTPRGKWIMVKTTQGWILINMGMGGEILLVDRNHLPVKHRLILDFSDSSCLSINFWWFGYVHFCAPEELAHHPMIVKLGPDVLSLEENEFTGLLRSQKGKVKIFLLDQNKVAGIGNAYIHDILFLARIHPNRPIASLTDEEIHGLFQAIQDGLRPSLAKGGAFYELNLFGEKGGFLMEDIIIGYRENTPCPLCGTPIQKIKTGSTSSFICPHCQPEI